MDKYDALPNDVLRHIYKFFNKCAFCGEIVPLDDPDNVNWADAWFCCTDCLFVGLMEGKFSYAYYTFQLTNV